MLATSVGSQHGSKLISRQPYIPLLLGTRRKSQMLFSKHEIMLAHPIIYRRNSRKETFERVYFLCWKKLYKVQHMCKNFNMTGKTPHLKIWT